jgi:hypothetical protein
MSARKSPAHPPSDTISRNQYAAMRKIARGTFTVEYLRWCKDATAFSLFKRGYIGRQGDYIVFTPAGYSVYEKYAKGEPPERKAEADITERTANLLKLVRIRELKSA